MLYNVTFYWWHFFKQISEHTLVARLAWYQYFATVSESESVLNPLNLDYEESVSNLKHSKRGYIGNWYCVTPLTEDMNNYNEVCCYVTKLDL